MTAAALQQELALNALCLPEPDAEVTGGYAGDLLSWVMGRAEAGNAWVTIMSNRNILAVATLAAVSAVVLAEDVAPDEGVREEAEKRGINLFQSPLSTFALCGRLAALL